MRAAVTVVLLLVLGLGLLWISQRRLIYFPSQGLPSAALFETPVEEVSYRADDGLALNAWYVPTTGPGTSITVVVFPGNAGNRAHRMPLANALAARGYGVLLVDYRGYGENQGRPSEPKLIADARAAVAYVMSRADVDRDRLVYFGESLGAGVAVALAEQEPPAALVLRSPFTSLPDIGSVHYPILPTSLMLWDRYPNLEIIPGLDVPVMIIAGSADTIVPTDQSRTLFEAANEPKLLVVIDGADHNDFALTAGEEMVERIAEFLDDRVAPGGD